jgi:TRAP-type C4-dicarboxylate transport system substrate-binding protein
VGSPLFLDTFTALGANPTQMSWADAQPALASGAVDGQENPLTIFTAAKMHTIGQKNVTLWGYVADPLIFVVNKEVWEHWTSEDRRIVREAAIEAGRYCIELARDGMTGPNPAMVKTIEGLGVNVVRLSAAEIQAFKKATRPVYDKWAKQIGAGLVKKAEVSIAARKK